MLAIPGSWHGAQKPLKPGNTESYAKNYEIPHPGSSPKNTEKIRKLLSLGGKLPLSESSRQARLEPEGSGSSSCSRSSWRGRSCALSKNGHFWAIFVFLGYFFRIFGAPPGVGNFVIFRIVFVFPGLRGCLSSVPGTRNRNPHARLGPENIEKKKLGKNIRKWSISGHFCNFAEFFS